MRLKDYLATYAAPATPVVIRGVAEWLEEQARTLAASDDVADRVKATSFEIAARELHDQRIVCWP